MPRILSAPDRAGHRAALRRKLQDGLILLSSAPETVRNNDVLHVFRQNSNFLYLTGVADPGYLLLLDPRRGQDTLFVPRVGTEHRVWLGHVPGPSQIRRRYKFSRARFADELPAVLRSLRKRYRHAYAPADTFRKFRSKLGRLHNRWGPLRDALDSLRAVKTDPEIGLLQRANDISGKAHRRIMALARPGMREYALQAEFERLCLLNGLRHQAYPPIVAAGKNGAVLHYHANDALLRTGELLLIDAGGELEGYAADITRTFPIGGRFTARQRDIYAIVLAAQKRCIQLARPGILSGQLHLEAMRVIAEGLRELRLLRGSIDDLIQTGAVRLFFPHGIGHMLGLDVHDPAGGKARHVPPPPHIRLRFNARLEPGFVITVEPGIYFNEALLCDPKLRRKHRGRVDFRRAEAFLSLGGIRIEDDIVIQPSGPALNLTSVPKEMDEISAACGR